MVLAGHCANVNPDAALVRNNVHRFTAGDGIYTHRAPVQQLVGLEDNLYLEKGVYASNASLTERAVEIIRLLGATVASPDEDKAENFAALIKSDYIYTNISDDIWGTEYSKIKPYGVSKEP